MILPSHIAAQPQQQQEAAVGPEQLPPWLELQLNQRTCVHRRGDVTRLHGCLRAGGAPSSCCRCGRVLFCSSSHEVQRSPRSSTCFLLVPAGFMSAACNFAAMPPASQLCWGPWQSSSPLCDYLCRRRGHVSAPF